MAPIISFLISSGYKKKEHRHVCVWVKPRPHAHTKRALRFPPQYHISYKWGYYPAPLYSVFRKSLCTYKRWWKWCLQVSKQAWTRLILFTNTFCRFACEMFLMYIVIAVFNSLNVRGWSRCTADFAANPQQINVWWSKIWWARGP